MNENLFEAQYDITKKSKILKFYETNKIVIFVVIFSIFIAIASFIYYSEAKEKKRTLLLNRYVEANIYLENDNRNKAKEILENIIFSNDSTYSTLSLFLIINENLTTDQKKVSSLFDHVLNNCKFETELKNLIIFKKALVQTSFVSESELLEALNPLLNKETLWKAHALLLLGDYFYSKNENMKAKEFYVKLLSLKNLHKYFNDRARLQLSLIAND